MNKKQNKKRMRIHKGETLPEEKLIGAAEAGNAALVKRLIKKGIDIHYVENAELGYNALHYASFNGHVEVVQDLIQAGANVNVLTTDNYTPLMLATLSGFTDVVNTILQISKPNLAIRTQDDSQPHNGMTCLHLAVLSGSDELVRLLISQGAEREALTSNGYSILHLAAEMGYTDILQTILTEVPSLHSSMHTHKHGAHSANTGVYTGAGSQSGSEQQPAFRYTEYGSTALHLAVASGVSDSVAILLADDASDANLPDQDGFTALHMAVTFQLRDTVTELLKNGVAVNTQAITGRTPLLDAVMSADYKIAELLLKYGADVTLADSTKLTPLIAAAAEGNEKIVRSLLSSYSTSSSASSGSLQENEGDAQARAGYISFVTNQQDEEGNTALHYAVEGGFEGIIKRLLRAGADTFIVNQAGQSPLQIAEEIGSPKLLRTTRSEVPAPASPTRSPLPPSASRTSVDNLQYSDGAGINMPSKPFPEFPSKFPDMWVSPQHNQAPPAYLQQNSDFIDLDVTGAAVGPTAPVAPTCEQTPSVSSAVKDDVTAAAGSLPLHIQDPTVELEEVCDYVLTDEGHVEKECWLQEVTVDSDQLEVGADDHDDARDSWESVRFEVNRGAGEVGDSLPEGLVEFELIDDLSFLRDLPSRIGSIGGLLASLQHSRSSAGDSGRASPEAATGSADSVGNSGDGSVDGTADGNREGRSTDKDRRMLGMNKPNRERKRAVRQEKRQQLRQERRRQLQLDREQATRGIPEHLRSDTANVAGRAPQTDTTAIAAIYEQKMRSMERQYEQRIAALQQQLRRLQCLSQEGHEWDQEIHFGSPGGRGVRPLARTGRDFHSISEGTCDRDGNAFGDVAAQCDQCDAVATSWDCEMFKLGKRMRRQQRAQDAQQADGFTVDQPPLPGTTLSKFDRSFLEALSFVLLMVALALLIFIRLRLLRS